MIFRKNIFPVQEKLIGIRLMYKESIQQTKALFQTRYIFVFICLTVVFFLFLFYIKCETMYFLLLLYFFYY